MNIYTEADLICIEIIDSTRVTSQSYQIAFHDAEGVISPSLCLSSSLDVVAIL